MDSASKTLTTPEVARALGVSLPAAHHALDTVGVPRRGRGRTRLLEAQVVEELLASRGKTPASDRSPSELRILAALSRSPLGQTSLRSIAAKAGVSPTTASNVIASLANTEYVQQREVSVASGRARRELRWFANSSSWSPELRESVRRTRLPQKRAEKEPLPAHVHHLFWNAEVSKLSPKTDGSYLAERLLQSPDIRAWQWALTNLKRADVETALSRRGVDERTRALARNWWADAL